LSAGVARRIRAFAALDLPRGLTERLGGLISELEGMGLAGVQGIRWTRPATMHLTLRFMGDIDERPLEAVCDALTPLGASYAPLSLRAGGLGLFPGRSRPRVLWVGIDESRELSALHSEVEGTLARVGIEPEGRGFRPHLTLCRIRGERASRAVSRLAAALPQGLEYEFTAASLTVFSSLLGKRGAEHTVIRRIRLLGP